MRVDIVLLFALTAGIVFGILEWADRTAVPAVKVHPVATLVDER